jgi:hypothetical protein
VQTLIKHNIQPSRITTQHLVTFFLGLFEFQLIVHSGTHPVNDSIVFDVRFRCKHSSNIMFIHVASTNITLCSYLFNANEFQFIINAITLSVIDSIVFGVRFRCKHSSNTMFIHVASTNNTLCSCLFGTIEFQLIVHSGTHPVNDSNVHCIKMNINLNPLSPKPLNPPRPYPPLFFPLIVQYKCKVVRIRGQAEPW